MPPRVLAVSIAGSLVALGFVEDGLIAMRIIPTDGQPGHTAAIGLAGSGAISSISSVTYISDNTLGLEYRTPPMPPRPPKAQA